MKPRNFTCPVTGERCEEGGCLATRCIIEYENRQHEALNRERDKWEDKQWRLSHPSQTRLSDLMDDE